MVRKKIFIVEDEMSIRAMLRFVLPANDFEVFEADDAKSLYRLLEKQLPDLILLDWMLPGESGIEITRRLRSDELTREIPIIMLTARAEEENKVKGLGVGADDYVIKPFSPRELLARIGAVLRRSSGENGDHLLQVRDLTLDLQRHEVSIQQQPINLTPVEFKLLHYFMTHTDRTCSREKLLNRVWGVDAYIDERTVDATVRRLRKSLKINEHDALIQTVRGVGYRFSEKNNSNSR